MKIPGSYDVVGDIAIIELSDAAMPQRRKIANALMERHKNIRTVLLKLAGRKGTYRVRGYEHLAGQRKTRTTHAESGCRFAVDVARAYFSVREGSERLRIARYVKDKERVLVMFAGVGPYAIIIAKQKDAEVCAIEMNPVACSSMQANVRTNKVMHRVFPYCGDVRTIAPKLGLFDRVVMPLPKEGYMYLDVALRVLKKGGIVHFYSVEPKEDLWKNPLEQLTRAAQKATRRVHILDKHIVLPYAPRVYKVCVDARVD